MNTHYQNLERAAFKAWPAQQELEDQGVVFRYAHGYTKRANSANILQIESYGVNILTPVVKEYYLQTLSKIESYFAEKQLPSIIRIPSFVDADLFDQFLATQSYQYQDKTLVLEMPLPNQVQQEQRLNSTIVCKKPDKWLDSFCALNNSEIAEHNAHLAILQRIEDKTMFAVLVEDGVEVACGLGVIHNQYLGIFDIVTGPQYRGKGYASKLLQGIYSWAKENGASQSYLQVVANNQAAVKLYTKLGYTQSYEYWYRIKQSV
ncbi:MAG: GNAT superfamily N-acetyltransferase [Oceanospirillaceae bacterium]|jgi:GNAT superfamily N-acetyltransferase